jgi:hypothetical protein
MRRKKHSRIRDNYITISLILLVLLLCNIFIISSPVAAQGEQLIIDVVDEVYENEDFFVSVYIINNSGIPTFLIDVELVFNGDPYYITDQGSGVATIQAPQVDEDTAYTITASKDGYASNQTTITVLNKLQLYVTPDEHTIEANKLFSVTVTDENENPIADATVAIQDVFGDGAIATTNSEGRAWLVAPEVGGEITVMAQKDGYVEGTTPLMVNIGPGFWESLLQSPYTPIFIAIIILIFAIVFVNLRQKESIDTRAREISKEQALKRYGAHGKIVSLPFSEKTGKPVNQYGPRGPKIEEIRISRPRKDKKIVFVESEKEEVRKVIPRKPKRKYDYDWFEGTDGIRYEIDRITGEIDEEGLDKWFEGIDDIRAKIDEKLKKKDKKKDK